LYQCASDPFSSTEEKLASPLPAIAPSGRASKRELQSGIQHWLDTLSNEEGVIFSLEDF
jgi:hypothetical protein